MHVEVFDERGAGLAGAHAGELVEEILDALDHRVFDFKDGFVRVHGGGWFGIVGLRTHSPCTRVPIGRPRRAWERFPFGPRSKMMIGMWLSMHRLKAVVSITLRRLEMHSWKVTCLVAFGVRVLPRIGVIDAVDLGGLEDDVGTHFAGAQRGGGVGGEKRIAGAGGENDHLAFVELAFGFAADEGFRDVFHFDGGLHDAAHAVVFERAFERQGVHHGGEHADVVGGGAVHAAGGGAGTAPEIPAAHDDAELQAGIHGFADFRGDAVDDFRGDVVPGVRTRAGLPR